MEVEAAAPAPMEPIKYSMHSDSAQFAEVAVNAVTVTDNATGKRIRDLPITLDKLW